MRRGLVLLALALLLLPPRPALAERLAVVTEEFPPYNYTAKDGCFTGACTEIVRRTLDLAGLTPNLQVLPWARAYETAVKRPGVLIYTILRTEKREDLFHWIGPLVPTLDINFYRLASRPDVRVRCLDDARRYSTAIMRDGVTHHYLKSQGFRDGRELDIASSEVLGLNKVLAGRVDLAIGNDLSVPWRLRAMGRSPDELVKLIPFMHSGYYMAFGKNTDPTLVERVRAAFEKASARGFDDILSRFPHMAP